MKFSNATFLASLLSAWGSFVGAHVPTNSSASSLSSTSSALRGGAIFQEESVMHHPVKGHKSGGLESGSDLTQRVLQFEGDDFSEGISPLWFEKPEVDVFDAIEDYYIPMLNTLWYATPEHIAVAVIKVLYDGKVNRDSLLFFGLALQCVKDFDSLETEMELVNNYVRLFPDGISSIDDFLTVIDAKIDLPDLCTNGSVAPNPNRALFDYDRDSNTIVEKKRDGGTGRRLQSGVCDSLSATVPNLSAPIPNFSAPLPQLASWIGDSGIGNETKISSLKLLGTHDSATSTYPIALKNLVKVQNMGITEQLEGGVRFLDLRYGYDNL